ncbi:MAG: glycoside hydrolase, partial [Gammaproteobacteria bacterium]|nr:glycoside hydrolase [Gammaproteobacteria bacterium]
MSPAAGAASQSSVARLPVVLLWHMHQPPYRDALDGQYVLPWTYLHAIKDYTDMAAHLEDNPAARAVVNFSPVLLEQLRDLSARLDAHLAEGAPLPDAVLAMLGPAPLPREPAQRLALLRACLRAHPQTMVQRFAPYQELVTLAATFASPERIGYAADAFLHDLAVWYHLAWLGETVRRSEPLAARLEARGRDFSAGERRELLGLIARLVATVVPRYRALAAAGRCELSVTPYAHPIVPLLLDFASAREAIPELPLPRHARYAGGAERSAWHIAQGLKVFQAAFGVRPAGCWPAEGAISTETLRLLARLGEFRWAASGGAVGRASLGERTAANPDSLHRPYRLEGTGMDCFFRDDGLSDLIGFTYATWHGDDAAHNLVEALTRLATGYRDPSQHAVLIALDGENAWEHYPFNGYYFLRALYAQLAAHPQLELTTLTQCLDRGLQPTP